MACSSFYYQGVSDCAAFREKVAGVILTEKTVTLNPDASDILADLKTILAGNTGPSGVYVSFGRGYQNNTSEPEITTSNIGLSEKTFDSPPQIKGFGEVGYCDYKSFFGADGRDFNVFLVLRDGTIEGVLNAAGLMKGRRAKLFTMFNAPMADNLQESYPFDLMFTDIQEWKENSFSIKPTFTANEIKDLVPVGLGVRVITAYTGGDVVVKATKRCSTMPATNLGLVTNWAVKENYGNSNPVISAVDATQAAFGIYTLTIHQGANADLTSPVLLQAIVPSTPAGYFDYLSNTIIVKP